MLDLVLVFANSAVNSIVDDALGLTNVIHPVTFEQFEHVHPPEDAAGPLHDADAVLVEWDLMEAAAFGAVCSQVHLAHGFVIALVPGGETSTTALAIGADTFHPLPPSAELLQAQILAHRRVWSWLRPTVQPSPPENLVLSVGPIWMDLGTGELGTFSGLTSETVLLSMRQSRVMACFLRSPSQTLSREQLLADAWGWDFDPGTNVVDVYVHYLRQLLGRFGLQGVIETVRGRGYRLSGEPRPVSPQTTELESLESEAARAPRQSRGVLLQVITRTNGASNDRAVL